jgi:hypothetical protein
MDEEEVAAAPMVPVSKSKKPAVATIRPAPPERIHPARAAKPVASDAASKTRAVVVVPAASKKVIKDVGKAKAKAKTTGR